MKKILDFDWLRAVQFKCNTSAKSVTPVQITNKNKNFKTNKKSNYVKKRRNNKRRKEKYILYHTSGRKKGAKNVAVCRCFTLAKLNESSPWQSCSNRSIWKKQTS